MRVLLLTICSFLFGYYAAILLHEWGHGTVAWLLGYKTSPFAIQYGGWFLMNVDEGVSYDNIFALGRGGDAALIGIAGVTVSVVLFILSRLALSKIEKGWLYSFVYWFAVWNLVPTVQYFTIQAFSSQGDTGRFVTGLGISPWWVVVPGVLFIVFAVYELLAKCMTKAFTVIPVKSIWSKRLFLFVTLAVLFWLIYGHEYNSLSDTGMPLVPKTFAVLLLLMVPILMYVCDPRDSSREDSLK